MEMSFIHIEMKSENCLLLNNIIKFTNMGGCILKMKKTLKSFFSAAGYLTIRDEIFIPSYNLY